MPSEASRAYNGNIKDNGASGHEFSAYRKSIGSIFSLPAPIKYVFDRTPLITYEANTLPARSAKPSRKPRLYVFSTVEDAAAGRPSFNPTCLKWQTYLRIAQISFDLVPSNNHASPTGILPFLIPAYADSSQKSIPPIPANNQLRKFVKDAGKVVEESDSPRYEPYQSLIDNSIRKAWIYTLYLEPTNAHIPIRLYVDAASKSTFVRKSLAHTLAAAARSEVLALTSTSGSSLSIFGGNTQEIDGEAIYRDAKNAFEALSTLLGEDEWFFGLEKPGEFDAGVFAYTHLLVDEKMGWVDRRVREMVEGLENLVAHRRRLFERCFEVVYE